MSETTRRGVLAGAAGVGAAAVLAACGTSTDTSSSPGTASTATGGAAAPTTGAATQNGSNGGGSTALAQTNDIPVGGGKVFEAQKVVVTQPKAGTFKCFSAICTHAGCTVGSVANGTISCPCHGSKFSATDGSVKGGPAPTGLDAKNITVSGDSITLA